MPPVGPPQPLLPRGCAAHTGRGSRGPHPVLVLPGRLRSLSGSCLQAPRLAGGAAGEGGSFFCSQAPPVLGSPQPPQPTLLQGSVLDLRSAAISAGCSGHPGPPSWARPRAWRPLCSLRWSQQPRSLAQLISPISTFWWGHGQSPPSLSVGLSPVPGLLGTRAGLAPVLHLLGEKALLHQQGPGPQS